MSLLRGFFDFMKKFFVLIFCLVLFGVGCEESGTSLLKNKITCEEKGEKYVKNDLLSSTNNWSEENQFVYNKKLDTCLVYSRQYAIEDSEYVELQSVEDFLTRKVLAFSRTGNGRKCFEEEVGCYTPEEFKKIKEELFR